MTIRILLVDDHSVVREGLRMFLGRDPDIEVVGEAADGAEAVEKARLLRPDLVLMDLLIPIMDGIAATAVIRHELPETEVIALTSMLERTSITNVIRAGAIGYLLKDAQAAELRAAIKAAAAGQIQLSPQTCAYLLREIRPPETPPPLTGCEIDILRLLAQGLSNRRVAQYMRISEDTVKTHVHHILSKLEVRSRTQAILLAMRLGLVPSIQNCSTHDQN